MVLGCIIYSFTGSYWLRTKRSALAAEAKAIATQAGALGGNLRYTVQMTEIVTSATESCVLVIVDDGTIAISDPQRVNTDITTVSADITKVALTEEYSAIGDLDGVLREQSVTFRPP